MSYNVYTLPTDEFETALTAAKNVFVKYLHDNKYLTDEQAEKLLLETAILIRKPTFFSNLWDKFTRTDQYMYVVVEQKTISKDISIEPPKGKLHVIKNDDKPKEK